ncbi:hypothetical protein EVAR_3333_1 [Eumeta japonica]|uniref:Uncharacterized protein n=1 Tax=Eumeta variegata TaxID=151549 RepID=A0A4C1SS58_EUMVA|nr:hypothetical protein EVAR_3333_1 [Eumeta japonica]
MLRHCTLSAPCVASSAALCPSSASGPVPAAAAGRRALSCISEALRRILIAIARCVCQNPEKYKLENPEFVLIRLRAAELEIAKSDHSPVASQTAREPSKSNWSPSSVDIPNPRGFITALLVLWKRKGYGKVIEMIEKERGDGLPKLSLADRNASAPKVTISAILYHPVNESFGGSLLLHQIPYFYSRDRQRTGDSSEITRFMGGGDHLYRVAIMLTCLSIIL